MGKLAEAYQKRQIEKAQANLGLIPQTPENVGFAEYYQFLKQNPDYHFPEPPEEKGVLEKGLDVLKYAWDESLSPLVASVMATHRPIGSPPLESPEEMREAQERFQRTGEYKLESKTPTLKEANKQLTFNVDPSQMSKLQKLSGQILSFAMPADAALFAVGGGMGNAFAKKTLPMAFGKFVRNRVAKGMTKEAAQEAVFKSLAELSQKSYGLRAVMRAPGTAGALGAYEGAANVKEQTLSDDAIDFLKVIKSIAKGTALGTLMSVGGALVKPGTKAIFREAADVASGTAAFGIGSPLLEGQMPTFESVGDAAEFIVGMKLAHGLYKLPKTADRYAAAIKAQHNVQKAIQKNVDQGKSISEAVKIEWETLDREVKDRQLAKFIDVIKTKGRKGEAKATFRMKSLPADTPLKESMIFFNRAKKMAEAEGINLYLPKSYEGTPLFESLKKRDILSSKESKGGWRIIMPVERESAIDTFERKYREEKISEDTYRFGKSLFGRYPDINARTVVKIKDQVMPLTEEVALAEGLEPGTKGEILGRTITEKLERGMARTTMEFYQGHDAKTILHEWYHEFYNRLPQAERAKFEQYYKSIQGKGSAGEMFATEGSEYALKNYIAEGAKPFEPKFRQAKKSFLSFFKGIRPAVKGKIPLKIQAMYRQAVIHQDYVRKSKGVPDALRKGKEEVLQGKREVKTKELWDMSQDELFELKKSIKSSDISIEKSILGNDWNRWKNAQKQSGSMDDIKASSADKIIKDIESKLSQDQIDRLYGVGEGGPSAEKVSDFHTAVFEIDSSSPTALGQSVGKALYKVGQETDPLKMTHEQQLAYTKIKNAVKMAEDYNYDIEVVFKSAMESAGKKFSDPADAMYMLRRYLPQGKQEVVPVESKQPHEMTKAEFGKSEIIPEWGTRNQYHKMNPYREQLDTMKKTGKFDEDIIVKSDMWEMEQVLKGKPGFLNDVLPESTIREFAEKNNLLVDKRRDGSLIVAKDEYNLRNIKFAKPGRELGLALGYESVSTPTRLKTHKGIVSDALREGKPVPPEVLADYPDLAAKYASPVSKTVVPEKGTIVPEKGINHSIRIYNQEAHKKVGATSQFREGMDKISKVFDFFKQVRNRVKLAESKEAFGLFIDADNQTNYNEGRWLSEFARGGLGDDKKWTGDKLREMLQVDAPGTESIRATLDMIRNEGLKTGIKIGKLKHYFPGVINDEYREKLNNDLNAIEQEIKELDKQREAMVKSGATEKEIKQLDANAIVLRAVSNNRDYLKKGLEWIQKHNDDIKTPFDAFKALQRRYESETFPTSPFEKHRVLELPPEFYEHDAHKVLVRYTKVMARRIGYAQVLGPRAEKYTRLLSKIMEKDYKEAEYVKDVWDIAIGKFELDHRPKEMSRMATDVWTSLQFMTKIGMGRATLLNVTQPTISIIPDMGVWNTALGGIRLFDPDNRSKIVRSGAVNHFKLLAMAGYRPEGVWGKMTDFAGKWSGFYGVNKHLNMLAASTFEVASKKWHRAAQKDTAYGRWARKRLSDFKIDWKQSLNEDDVMRGMYRFAMDSQLQKNIMKDMYVMHDPKFRWLFLFKRFGYRQATLIKDMMFREVARGNPLPALRLIAAGYAGGAFATWGLNLIRTHFSGQPVYRKDDDDLWQKALHNLSSIGALGMLSDIGEIEDVTAPKLALKAADVSKFNLLPVVVSDFNRLHTAWTRFHQDWDKYGDFWLATERNAYNIGGFLGSLPNYTSQRLLTDYQMQNRIKYYRDNEKETILKSLIDGDSDKAKMLVKKWNDAYKDQRFSNRKPVAFNMNEFSYKAIKTYLDRELENWIKAAGEKDKAVIRKKKTEARKKLGESGSIK